LLREGTAEEGGEELVDLLVVPVTCRARRGSARSVRRKTKGRKKRKWQQAGEGKERTRRRTRFNRNHETLRLLMDVVPDLATFTGARVDDLLDLLAPSEGGGVAERGEGCVVCVCASGSVWLVAGEGWRAEGQKAGSRTREGAGRNEIGKGVEGKKGK
jgi:hypothetical protein